ncbi:RRM1_TatSF1_like and RRM2_TatSF1_like domain-containing protein barc [Dermatophagoides pteronyssinus]|uniref:RRM1_TatSF1_like and RRM2_TatSF1_like domain-containing protein barc n=1 Tax=Dermatophagoides pteronyssinus TaxID=6956 RepID=UPI003F6713B0
MAAIGDDDDNDFAYQLEQEELERKKQQQSCGNESNSNIFRDPSDGMEYEWDPVKKAWFPRINDDFIAKYQASYGHFEDDQQTKESESIKDNDAEQKSTNAEDQKPMQSDDNQLKSSSEQQQTTSELSTKKRPRDEPPEPPKWFEIDDEHNTNVYVSNLPLDITMDEFTGLMKKCGLIMKDDRGQLKIKLYTDSNGKPKGDGRCCYIKVESVDLALKILDGYHLRDTDQQPIKVERAKFSLKGEYNPLLKPKKKKLNKKDREKQRKRMEKLFDWRPDKLPGERPKSEKTIIIKNMFDVKTFENDPRLILEYKTDIREECEEKCGPVRKVDIYDRNPEGVATVTFNEFDDADKCVELMNGRFFAGRKLDAKHWDGKTRYKIEETDEEIQKRIRQWDEFLEQPDDEPKQQKESIQESQS